MSNALNAPIQLRQKRDFSQVIGTGFQFIRENWKGLYRPLVIIGLPLTVIGALSTASQARSNLFVVVNEGIGTPSTMLWRVAGFLCSVLANLFICAATFEYMRLYVQDGGRQPGLAAIWRGVRGRLLSYIAVGLLCGVMIIVGTMLLFIPGVYFAVTFSLAFPLLSLERASVGDAIGRSFKLIGGNWWRTCFTIVFLFMMTLCLVLVLWVPLWAFMGISAYSSVKQGLDPASDAQHYLLLTTVYNMLVSVAGVLLQPLLLVPIGVNAYSLLEQKEGKGLMQRVDEITFGQQD